MLLTDALKTVPGQLLFANLFLSLVCGDAYHRQTDTDREKNYCTAIGVR